MGDGGFTFNREGDEQVIHGFKPCRKSNGGALNAEEKIYNRKLSEVRVVVENAIHVIKAWKIMGGIYRHWRNGKGSYYLRDLGKS